jgi:outer membrane lipase/esterase
MGIAIAAWLRAAASVPRTASLCALSVVSLCAAFGSPAAATPYDAFYAFGDSTLDSGWFAGALNGQCGAVTAPCKTGNPILDGKIASAIAAGGTGTGVGVGKMNSEILAGYFGLTAKPANQPGGTNYAIGGALSAAVAGMGSIHPNANLPSTVGQITTYLANHGNAADPNALYLVGSGGNDVTYAQQNFGTQTAQETFLAGQAQSLANMIGLLQADGAHNLVVNGLQGSGPLPTYFTAALFSDLSMLGVKFVADDIAGLIQTVENNPSAYGFTANHVMPGVPGSMTESACVAGLGATGWGQFCANETAPDPNHGHLRAANSEQTSFWADDQHLSAAGQVIEAQYELSQIDAVLDPTPLPGTLPLFASGLAVMGLFARRSRCEA